MWDVYVLFTELSFPLYRIPGLAMKYFRQKNGISFAFILFPWNATTSFEEELYLHVLVNDNPVVGE